MVTIVTFWVREAQVLNLGGIQMIGNHSKPPSHKYNFLERMEPNNVKTLVTLFLAFKVINSECIIIVGVPLATLLDTSLIFFYGPRSIRLPSIVIITS
jgi:hypothetical protein